MRVYKLAKQLNVSSKDVLDAALKLNIEASSHQSSLTEDEVKRIIQYFEKNKKIGLLLTKPTTKPSPTTKPTPTTKQTTKPSDPFPLPFPTRTTLQQKKKK